jgi:diguanylate cyclase (GGDEF)-like protein/PAS domain S-box-containing protein
MNTQTMAYAEEISAPVETLVDIGRIMGLTGAWIANLKTGRVMWCDQTCKILDIPAGSSETIERSVRFFAEGWRRKITILFSEAARSGTSFDDEFQLIMETGQLVWVQMIGEAVRDRSGKVIRIQGAVRDISNFKASPTAASRVSAQLNATLENVTDAFMMVDREWNFTYLNCQAERLLGCKREEVIGTNIWARFPQAVGGPYHQQYHRAIQKNRMVAFEEYYAPLNLWAEIRAYPSDAGLAIYFLDIGERKATEEKIRRLAFHDVLTGLPNRRYLMDRLEHAVQLNRRTHSFGALLFIDLDDFKAVNDTRGHDKGDMLLQLAAERLDTVLRASDTVARVGGDEFIVLLGEVAKSEDTLCRQVKDVAQKILANFRRPFLIDGMEHYTTASIGATVFNGDAITSVEALKQADLAMYDAKNAGRNTVSFFNRHIADRLQTQISLKADLLQAIEENQFILYYQPQVDMAGHVTGVEALVRWNHPQRGLIPPTEFIPLAEANGMILPLGQWVLTSACQQLSAWAKADETSQLTIAVNVSVCQLRRPGFVEQVLQAITETGANANRLKFELTESVLIEDVEGTILKMKLLQDIGIGFSLDDFGTGYSSLSYLHRLPLDQLKIDRSFIQSAVDEEHGATIARAIVALGKALNLTVLAEGVETDEQYAFVLKEGCTSYQGYLFSIPVAASQITSLMRHEHTR